VPGFTPCYCAADSGKHSRSANILATIAAGMTGVRGLRHSMTPRLASASALTCPTVPYLHIIHRRWQSIRVRSWTVGMCPLIQVLWGGRTPSVTQALVTPSTSMWAMLDRTHAVGMYSEQHVCGFITGSSVLIVHLPAEPLPPRTRACITVPGARTRRRSSGCCWRKLRQS
jgi:hypothetical protein